MVAGSVIHNLGPNCRLWTGPQFAEFHNLKTLRNKSKSIRLSCRIHLTSRAVRCWSPGFTWWSPTTWSSSGTSFTLRISENTCMSSKRILINKIDSYRWAFGSLIAQRAWQSPFVGRSTFRARWSFRSPGS